MKNSILVIKSKAFALRIIRLVDYLLSRKKEYVLTNQLSRCGTSVGANVREAFFGQSLPDFISKLSISLKECGETQYWLELMKEAGRITERQYESLNSDCEELIRILVSSLRTAKRTLERRKNGQAISKVGEPELDYGDNPELEALLEKFSLQSLLS